MKKTSQTTKRLLPLFFMCAALFLSCSEDDTSGSSGSGCNLDKEAQNIISALNRLSDNPSPANCENYKKVYQEFYNKAKSCKELSTSHQSLFEANSQVQSMDCNVYNF